MNKLYISHTTWLWVLIICLFYRCAPPRTVPDWIHKQPTTPGYWYGVGTVAKPYPDEYRELARTRALEEIASQISVKISSAMVNVVTELNYDLNQYTRSIKESRLSQILPSIEYLESYETDNRFYFLVRLFKQEYYDSIEESRKNAITTATGYLEKAEAAFGVSSFTNLGNAWLEVGEYLDKPIEIEYPRGSARKENLYSLIKLKFADYIQRIELTPSVGSLSVKVFVDRDRSFTVRCTDKKTGQPIQNLPLVATLSSDDRQLKSTTDNKGIAEFNLNRITAKSRNQVCNIIINLVSMVDSSAMVLAPLSYPGTQVNLSVTGPNIFVQSVERNLGSELNNPVISSAVKEFCVSEFSATFTSREEADFVIILDVDTKEKSKLANKYGLFIAWANASLKFVNSKTGDEMYSKSITNVKGADFTSLQLAGERAIDELAERMREKVLPEIITTLNE